MQNEEKRILTPSDIEKLLGSEITKFETKKLTAPGDNYGSYMLAVNATLKYGGDVALVAKMFPLDEVAQNIFRSPISMKKEIGVYQIINPEYEKIQEEHSVAPSQRLHIFCSCPGARLSLEDTDEEQLADEYSVLLLENLKILGYRLGDRTTGLDIEHTEFVLKHLAKFHATAVAIKLQKPLVFRNKIIKTLIPFKISPPKEEDESSKRLFIEGLETIPACNRNTEALREIIREHTEFSHSSKFRPTREPFSTFVHNDFWTNNMMFKYKCEINEDPVDLKVVDFQLSHHGSPVSDIMLFLFTSVETGIVSGLIDHFLQLYHKTFLDWLKTLGCETKPFSYENFLEEVKIAAPLNLANIIFMLMPITFNKEQVERFGEGIGSAGKPPEFNDVYILKVSEAIDTFAEKGWL